MPLHFVAGFVHTLPGRTREFQLAAGLQGDFLLFAVQADDGLALENRLPPEPVQRFQDGANTGRAVVRQGTQIR